MAEQLAAPLQPMELEGTVVELSPQGYGRISINPNAPDVFFSFDKIIGFSGLLVDANGGVLAGPLRQGARVKVGAVPDRAAKTYVANWVKSLGGKATA